MSFDRLKNLLENETGDTPKPGSKMQHTVLIVDDDKAVREALTFVLSREMNVVSADNAEAGLAALTEDNTVVVLDVKMAGKDGFWAASQMRLRFEDVPLIFHSAYQGTKDPIAIINDHRPFAFVNKGDNTNDILDAVRNATRYVERREESRFLRQRLSDLEGRMKSIMKPNPKPGAP